MTEHDDIARRLREAVETTPARDEDIDVIAANARRRRTVRRAVTTGVTAVLVVVAVVTVPGLVRRLDRPDRIELADRPTATSSVAPERVPAQWEQLPPSPLDARWGAFSASTGDELLIWGGYGWGSDEGPRSDGAIYDGTGWSELPDSPLPALARTNGVAAWTGDELWIVGGTGGDDGRTPVREAAAYSPATRTWRELPSVPEPISGGAWTGDQLVVVAAGTDGPRGVYTLQADGGKWGELGTLPPPSAADNSDLHVLAADSRVAVVGLGDIFVRDLSSDASDWQDVGVPVDGDGLSNVRGAAAEARAFVVVLPDGTYRYDLDAGAWSRIAGGLEPDPPQPVPLLRMDDHMVVAVDVVNARVQAVSGDDSWAALAELDEPRVDATAEIVDGQIVVWGGMGSEQQGSVQGASLRAPESSR